MSTIDSGTKILIVEDATLDQKMLTEICSEVGFTLDNIFVRNELKQATEVLHHGWVDIVLLDLALDDSDNPTPAIKLLEAWDHETRNKKIPVIVVSRHTEEVKRAARAASAVVIRKPGTTDVERTQFSDFLQYAIRTAIARKSSEPRSSPIDSGTRVLIVEDATLDQRMLTEICSEVGFTLDNILVCNELNQATEMLKHVGLDIVLLDLALDDSDNPTPAIKLLEAWERDTRKKKIPVIVVSRLTEEVKRAARAASAVVIRKPGTTAGERTQFSDFLQYAIRTAIARKSDGSNLWDRVRGLNAPEKTEVERARSIASDESPGPYDSPKEIMNRTYKTVLELGSETLVMVLALGAIALIHWVLDKLLGRDFLFFDLIPIRWLIGVGDLVVIARFLLGVVATFWRRQ